MLSVGRKGECWDNAWPRVCSRRSKRARRHPPMADTWDFDTTCSTTSRAGITPPTPLHSGLSQPGAYEATSTTLPTDRRHNQHNQPVRQTGSTPVEATGNRGGSGPVSRNQTALGLQAMTIEPGDRGRLRSSPWSNRLRATIARLWMACLVSPSPSASNARNPARAGRASLARIRPRATMNVSRSLGIGLAVHSGHKFADNLRVAPESTKDSSAILSVSRSRLRTISSACGTAWTPLAIRPHVALTLVLYRGPTTVVILSNSLCSVGHGSFGRCLELGASPPVLRCVEIGVLGELREVGNPSRRRVSRLRGQRRPPASKHQGTLSVGAGASDPLDRSRRQAALDVGDAPVRMRHYGRIYESATKTTNRFVVPIR